MLGNEQGGHVQFDRHPSGRGYRLTTSLTLPHARDEIFAFFSDAHQLEAITPPWLQFHVTSLSTPSLEQGTLIDYRLRLRGIPVHWRSRISIWEPVERFVDEQVIGPYRWWRHEHRFVAHGSATEIVDTVDYGVPFGFFVHPLLVRPDLRKVFEYRRLRMLELFPPSA